MISRRTFVQLLSWSSLSVLVWTPSLAVGENKRGLVSSGGAEFDYYVSTKQTLPVELTEWSAQVAGERVVLTWRTTSETNNVGFYVDHQGPGKDREWNEIGFVEGSGTTDTPVDYRHVVEEVEVGRHRFRLRQVDADGTVESTDPRAVSRIMKEAVHLSSPSPNPVQTRATFSFSVRERTSVTVSMYDVLGRKVKTLYRGTPSAEKLQTVQVNAQSIASGTYFIRLVAGDRVETRRCVVVSK